MRSKLGVLVILAIVCLCALPVSAAIIYTETFDGPALPGNLTYTSFPPNLIWVWSSNGGGQLLADSDGTANNTIYATTIAGYIAPPGYSSVYSVDAGSPTGVNPGAYNVALRFGDYYALFHPGYSGGAFRMEGGYSQGNLNMGYSPRLGELHHIVAKVFDFGSLLKVDISITGHDANPLDSNLYTFNYSFIDTSPNLNIGMLGARRSGGGVSDGFFDNLQFETQPVPEPSVAALLGSGLLGGLLLLWRRNKRFWP